MAQTEEKEPLLKRFVKGSGMSGQQPESATTAATKSHPSAEPEIVEESATTSATESQPAQPETERKTKMAAQHSTRMFGSMALAVVVAFSLAWISMYFLQPKSGKMAVYIFLGALFLIGIIVFVLWSLWLLCLSTKVKKDSTKAKKDSTKAKKDSTKAKKDSTHAPERKAVVITKIVIGGVGLIVFAFFAIAYDWIINDANVKCISVYKEEHCDYYAHISRVVYHSFKITFMVLQILFLAFESYNFVTFGRTKTKCVFIYNSIVNFFVIIYTTLNAKGSHSMMTNVCPTFIRPNATDPTMTNSQAGQVLQCLTYETDAFKLAKQWRPYLYPFHCEYSILAITLNLILWKHLPNIEKPSPKPDGEESGAGSVEERKPDEEESGAGSVEERKPDEEESGAGSVEEPVAQTHSSRPEKPDSCRRGDIGYCIITVLGMAGLIACIVLTALWAKEPVGRIIFIIILYYSVIFIILSLLLTKGTKFPETWSVDSIVLILSACAVFLFDAVGIIGPLYDLVFHPQDNFTGRNATVQCTILEAAVDIGFLSLDCGQVALQTVLVINNHWIMEHDDFNDVISSSTTMQRTLMTWMTAANLTQWLIGFVVISHDVQYYCGPYLYYNTWEFVSDALDPFVLFYRFHCAMEFGEYTCMLCWPTCTFMLCRCCVEDAKKRSGASAGTPANQHEMVQMGQSV